MNFVVPVVDDKNFLLAVSSEETTARAGAVIEQLVGEEVQFLKSALSVKAAGHQLIGLMVQIGAAESPDDLIPLKERFHPDQSFDRNGCREPARDRCSGECHLDRTEPHRHGGR